MDLPRAEALREQRLTGGAAAEAAARARALGDATRLGIAAALERGGELCVCDLAWITGRAENLVSHHLKALRAQALASSRREGRMVLYALTADGRRLLAAVLAPSAERAG